MRNNVLRTLFLISILVALYVGPLPSIKNQIFYSIVDESQLINSTNIISYKLNNHNLHYSFIFGERRFDKYMIKSPIGDTFLFGVVFITFMGKYRYLKLLLVFEIITTLAAILLFLIGLQTHVVFFILSWLILRYINSLLTLGTPVLAYISSYNLKQNRTFLHD